MAVPLYQAKAELFRTLGHPARIRVLELLCERPHAVHELRDQVVIEASNLRFSETRCVIVWCKEWFCTASAT